LQWARIVLVVERGVSPAQRLKKLMDYSQPMSDGRRALVLRLNQSVRPNNFITILAVIMSIQSCQQYCIVEQSPVTVFPNISFLVAGILLSFLVSSQTCACYKVPTNFFCFTLISLGTIMVQNGVFHAPAHEQHLPQHILI
jgi:hypothetical protein